MLQSTDGLVNLTLGIPLPACQNFGICILYSLISRLSQLENKPGLFLLVVQTDGLKRQLEGVPSKEAHFREALWQPQPLLDECVLNVLAFPSILLEVNGGISLIFSGHITLL